MTKLIEPIREAHYRCPVEGCNLDLGNVSYEKALAHTNQQVWPELPIGLVYRAHSRLYGSGFKVICKRKPALTEQHSPHYSTFFIINWRFPDRELYFGYETTREFVNGLNDGIFFLVDRDTFSRLRNLHASTFSRQGIVPVRDVPGIEQMIERARTEKNSKKS